MSVFRLILLLSCALFSLGVYGILTRRNAIGLLLSIELILNAAALNFVLFGRLFLHVGAGEVDRRHDCARRWVGIVAGVDGACAETCGGVVAHGGGV